jgi:phosphoenolpyruvate phosphomutase
MDELLSSSNTEFLMECHSGLSAIIAERAGFKGLWASGLSISAMHGYRDNNELSWSHVLNTIDFITDSVQIPLLVDGDTGYGDFNNVNKFVKRLVKVGAAGICLEDKLFPKSNSFAEIDNSLIDKNVFAGKICAAKDGANSDDFTVVARCESFISGLDLNDALTRCELYRRAGADAILIHSKMNTAIEVLSFAKEWGNRCPLIIVPTTYASTNTEVFQQNKISMVIWANHLLRASVKSMQNVAEKIYANSSVSCIENEIASINDIFEIQNMNELYEMTEKYSNFK